MADDVNNSSKPVNSVNDVGASSLGRGTGSVLETLKRARTSVTAPITELKQKKQKLQELQQQRDSLQQELNDALSQLSNAASMTEAENLELQGELAGINQLAEDLEGDIRKTSGQIFAKQSTVTERVAASEQRAVSRFVSPQEQEARVRRLSSGVNTLEPGIRAGQQLGWKGMEEQKQKHLSTAASIGEQIEAAQEAGLTSKVKELAPQLEAEEMGAGVMVRGQAVFKKEGKDPESRMHDINKVSERATGRMHFEKTMETGGDGRTVADINKDISGVAVALGELKAKFEAGAIGLDEFNQEAGKAADKFKDLEIQEKSAAAAGGGGASGRWAGRLRGAAMAGRTAIEVGQVTQVDQRIAAMNNVGQVARQQNEQYDAVTRAIQGDMMAASMVLGGGFENAAMFQENIGTTQMRVKMGQGVVETADATAAAAEAYSSVGIVPALKGMFKGGQTGSVSRAAVSSIIDPAARATMIGSDIANRVSEGQAGNTAYQAALNAQREIAKIPVRQMQKYSDYTKSLGIIGREIGDASHITSTMDSTKFIDTMARNRIGDKRAVEMVNQGVAEQGADVFAPGQLLFARGGETAGLGSMESQVSRMGQLAQQGSKDPMRALGKIMEESVSRGFSNSKGVQLMVDSIQSLAQQGGTAQLGIDASGGITALVGRALGNLNPNRSMQAQYAAANTAIQQSNTGLTDTTISLSNIVRDKELRETLGDPLQAANFATMSRTQLSTLQRGVAKDAKTKEIIAAEDLVFSKGTTNLFDNSGKLNATAVNKAITTQNKFQMRGGAGGVGFTIESGIRRAANAEMQGGITRERAMELVKTQQGRTTLGAATGVQNQFAGGNGTGLTAINMMYGSDKGDFDPNRKFRTAKDKALDEQSTTEGFVGATELKRGKQQLGDVENLRKNLNALEKNFKENIDNFSNAAADAAESMRNDINTKSFKDLGTAVDGVTTKFNSLTTSLDVLIKRAGVKMNPTLLPLPETDSKTKQGGSYWGGR